MEICLTEEQREQLFKDECLDIKVSAKDSVYIELDKDGFLYGEVVLASDDNRRGRNKVCFGYDELQRLVPRQTVGRTFYGEKACPKCFTGLNFHYAYCPFCGQKLTWEEE